MAGRSEVTVTGLRETRAALKRLDDNAPKELAAELKKAAEPIVADASRRVPRRSGQAADSIRLTGGASIYLTAGKARVPYYGWLDFGGDLKPAGGRTNTQARPYKPRGRYLYPAIDAHRRDLERAAERALEQARRGANLP